MAIISFGATFRGANAGFALTNTTAQTVVVPAFGLNILGNATEFVSLNEFDAYMRSPRNSQVYDRNNKGGLYVDDVASLGALLHAGTLLLKAATYNSATNVFTVGATETITASADGSVFLA
jgi:hypothetical protein